MLWPILQMWIIWCEKPPASLEQCTEVILCKELKQSYCEILESLLAVFAKLSWNFHPSLRGCSALAGNRQYITCLSIYYRDITCFDGLYLKKSRSPCSDLGGDISFGPNGAPLGARWWSTRIISCRATEWTRETKLNRLNYRNFPLYALAFAGSVPRAQFILKTE